MADAGAPPLGWLEHLDEADRREFLAELFVVARGALHSDDADVSRLQACLRSWEVTAEALSDPARREVLMRPLAGDDLTDAGLLLESGLCKRCDVYVGYQALGVVSPPNEHAGDREWLGSHCWVCERSRDEIARAPW